MLFAVQPANAEVVAYVSGRSTGLMTPLLLGALLLYDQKRLLGALGLFVAAGLAKEHALMFPLIVLVWESTRVPPEPRRLRFVLAATLVAALVFGVLLGIDHYRTLLSHAVADKMLLQNVLANARAIPEMLSLWVRPWALSADHDG